MEGMHRHPGDFTVPASFPLNHLWDPGHDPHWIRAPDPGEAPTYQDGWFVRETHKYWLVHPNARPIRHADTIGMFGGHMTLVFDGRPVEEIQREVAARAAANPRFLAELVDDIEPGFSPRESLKASAATGFDSHGLGRKGT